MPYDYEDTLEPWHVTVTYGMAGDEEWEDEEEDKGGHAPAAGTEIGHLILWRLRDYTGDNRGRRRTPSPAISRSLSPRSLAVPDAPATAPRSRRRSCIRSVIC